MLQLPPANIIQIGIDEAGRGALAFPVFSAAVILPSEIPININDIDLKHYKMIKDSKKLSKLQREKCADCIKKYAIAYDVNFATVEEIDTLNIMNATFLSMHRCIKNIRLAMKREKNDEKERTDISNYFRQEDFEKEICLMVDGDRFRPFYDEELSKILPYECVTNGDSIHMNIAAASILAKVGRDNFVDEYCRCNPKISFNYGFSSHKAYGTRHHMRALEAHGPLEVHRKSFGPVRKHLKNNTLINKTDEDNKNDEYKNEDEMNRFNMYRNVKAFLEDED